MSRGRVICVRHRACFHDSKRLMVAPRPSVTLSTLPTCPAKTFLPIFSCNVCFINPCSHIITVQAVILKSTINDPLDHHQLLHGMCHLLFLSFGPWVYLSLALLALGWRSWSFNLQSCLYVAFEIKIIQEGFSTSTTQEELSFY